MLSANAYAGGMSSGGDCGGDCAPRANMNCYSTSKVSGQERSKYWVYFRNNLSYTEPTILHFADWTGTKTPELRPDIEAVPEVVFGDNAFILNIQGDGLLLQVVLTPQTDEKQRVFFKGTVTTGPSYGVKLFMEPMVCYR